MSKRTADAKRNTQLGQAQAWVERIWPPVSRYMPVWLTGITLLVYLLTMAPRLTWEHAGRDGGDLITAAFVMGVPHPPGYPTYMMLAIPFTRLPFGSVAWRVHLLSALASSATVVLIYQIGLRLAPDRRSRWAILGSAVGALLLGFAPLFWGQALIAEVYALHLFFISLVLLLMLRWRDGDGHLAWAALAFGVGMGDHITLSFLVPFILLMLVIGRSRLSLRSVVACVASG
jgi:4-amino-4-deoxy-L-arabinose transferase-like glycosyltransferase